MSKHNCRDEHQKMNVSDKSGSPFRSPYSRLKHTKLERIGGNLYVEKPLYRKKALLYKPKTCLHPQRKGAQGHFSLGSSVQVCSLQRLYMVKCWVNWLWFVCGSCNLLTHTQKNQASSAYICIYIYICVYTKSNIIYKYVCTTVDYRSNFFLFRIFNPSQLPSRHSLRPPAIRWPNIQGLLDNLRPWLKWQRSSMGVKPIYS